MLFGPGAGIGSSHSSRASTANGGSGYLAGARSSFGDTLRDLSGDGTRVRWCRPSRSCCSSPHRSAR